MELQGKKCNSTRGNMFLVSQIRKIEDPARKTDFRWGLQFSVENIVNTFKSQI
jgi:hypothetical protein